MRQFIKNIKDFIKLSQSTIPFILWIAVQNGNVNKFIIIHNSAICNYPIKSRAEPTQRRVILFESYFEL